MMQIYELFRITRIHALDHDKNNIYGLYTFICMFHHTRMHAVHMYFVSAYAERDG